MNKSSILICPNERLLNPESIKAFAENGKDSWNLLLIDHHPDLKVQMDNLYQAYLNGADVLEQFGDYTKRIQEISSEYGANQAMWVSINDWLVELEWIIEDEVHDSPEYLFDQMMAFNSLISSFLVMAVVPQLVWVDARDYIKTDENYGDPKLTAKIDWSQFDDGKRYLSQAFLGSTTMNNSTMVMEVSRDSLWLRDV
jgi:hypothetical protein